ncbi:hypothetical protein D1007_24071 [Hordeum vulgare]|nr:hypothetical protein D1007_24071 [Hordeum vulgare]
MEEDAKADWAITDSFPSTQKPLVDECESSQLVRDDEDDEVVVINGRATVPKDNRHVMRNKWEKTRISRDVVATKMSSTWTCIFSTRENKKEERYKVMLDAQKDGMEWDQIRTGRMLEIESEKIELEK